MPRMILDGDDLEVLLARNDLREDAALRRLVRRAQRELERLVVGELDRAAPLTLAERLVEAAAAAWRRSRLVRLTAAVASGIALGLALGAVLDPLLAPRRSDNPTATTNRSTAGSMPPTVAPAPVPYRDLAATYSGPEVELPRRAPRPLDLRYSPPDRSLLLTAVRIWGIDESGAALHPAAGAALRPYPGAPCSGPCTEISLAIEADPGTIRLPVPTDQVVVEESATLDGVPVSLWLTGNAEVAIVTESAVSGRIRFQTTAATAPIQAPAPTWPSLPPPLSLEARALGQLPLQMRVDEAVALVTSRVSYDRSPRAGERHRRAAEAGASFVTRTLEIGSGDCDVLNALLASVLQAAGVECCLAVGWVGLNGTTLPGLHAWVEYRDRTGGWRVADASSVAQTSPSDAGPGDPAASVLTSTATQEPAPRADTTPAPALGSTMEGDPRRALIIAAAVAFSALVAAAAIALLVASRRTRSTTGRAEDAGRLEDIIRGALRRPQAFAHIRTLFERPVVPLRSGRRISLRRCLRLSRTGRLYGAATDSTLSLRATSVGAAVLDTARREGRAVASLLAADDLDEWASMLDQRLGTPATDLLNRALRRAGEQIRAYEFLGAGDGPRVLDLRGIDPKLPTRVVLVPSDCALAHDVALSHETVGAFVLGDATVHALGLSQARQARVLFPLAARLIANRTAE